METARFPHQAMRCAARTLGGKRLLQAADFEADGALDGC